MAGTTIRSPFDDADADIIFRSADLVDFRLYKVILAKASAVFRDMLAIPDVNVGTGDPQIVELAEDADTLDGLLRFCYPVERAVFRTVDEVLPVFTAAKKYDIEVAVNNTRRAVLELAEKERPLRAYAIACAHELPALARKAARLLIREADFMGLPSMPIELPLLSSEVLYAFARYRSQCLTAVRGVLDGNFEWLRAGDHAYKMHVEYKINNCKVVLTLKNSWIWFGCSDCPRNPSVKLYSSPSPCFEWYFSTLSPCLWWVHYEAAVKETLLCGGLNGSVATGQALLDQVVREAETCSTCAPHARAHLMIYAQALEKRIENAIDEVEFGSPFAVHVHPEILDWSDVQG